MNKLIFLFAVAMSTTSFAETSDSSAYTVISFEQAIKENKVKTLFAGSENPKRYYRITDANGLHYGRCMDVILESQLDTFAVLKLDAGYKLMPDDTSFQTMYVTKTIEFPLYPKEMVPFNIYAMCGDMNKKAPHYEVTYSLGNMADTNVLSTIKIIEREYLQNLIGQHMIWAVTNDAGKEDLLKHGADSISILKTTSYLADNKIDCKLVRENQNTKKGAKEKPAFMKVSKLLFYGGITYGIVVSAGLVFLAAYSYKRRVKVRI